MAFTSLHFRPKLWNRACHVASAEGTRGCLLTGNALLPWASLSSCSSRFEAQPPARWLPLSFQPWCSARSHTPFLAQIRPVLPPASLAVVLGPGRFKPKGGSTFLVGQMSASSLDSVWGHQASLGFGQPPSPPVTPVTGRGTEVTLPDAPRDLAHLYLSPCPMR